jgi:CIC family chloride channel protein
MGAVFAAGAHAPITAILIMFELTGDYRIMLPLMMTVVIATVVAQKIMRGESIYTLKLTRRGIRLQRGHDVDVMQSVQVDEVMRTRVDNVGMDVTLTELAEVFTRSRHQGLPVLDNQEELWGMVTVSDLDRAVADEVPRSTLVKEIGTPRDQLLVAYPDETMGEALTRMSRRGLANMPVVDRDAPNRLLGLIRRPDITRAYNLGLSRRAELQHRAKRIQLRNLDGTEFIDVRIGANDAVVGKTVQEIAPAAPNECIFISIRREGQVLIPHGDTVFQPGDQLTVFVRSKDVTVLQRCLVSNDRRNS